MKTKEVIKEVERMKLEAEIRGNDMLVIHSGRESIASINLKTKFEINTSLWAFTNLLAEDEREKIYVLLTKLAETDLEDREEEKKYYLKHKWISYSGRQYLNLNTDKNKYDINSKSNSAEFKTQFTLEEINKIKEKFNTDLSDFEIVEVKNEIEN